MGQQENIHCWNGRALPHAETHPLEGLIVDLEKLGLHLWGLSEVYLEVVDLDAEICALNTPPKDRNHNAKPMIFRLSGCVSIFWGE